MRRSPLLLGLLFAAACGGDSSTGPALSGEATAAIHRLELAADTMEAQGNFDVGGAFRVIADFVRITGGVSTLDVTEAGTHQTYDAIAIKLSSPQMVSCDPFFGCDTMPAVDEHILLAWRQNTLDRAIAVIADSAGTMSVAIDTSSTSEIGLGAVGISVDRSQSALISTAGSESQQLVSSAGACGRPTSSIPEDVHYTCVRGAMRTSFNMSLTDTEHLFDPVPPAPVVVSMASTDVAAAHMTVSQSVGRAMMRKLRPARVEHVALAKSRAHAGRAAVAKHR